MSQVTSVGVESTAAPPLTDNTTSSDTDRPETADQSQPSQLASVGGDTVSSAAANEKLQSLTDVVTHKQDGETVSEADMAAGMSATESTEKCQETEVEVEEMHVGDGDKCDGTEAGVQVGSGVKSSSDDVSTYVEPATTGEDSSVSHNTVTRSPDEIADNSASDFLALSYLVHPPDGAAYDRPYADDFWKCRWSRMEGEIRRVLRKSSRLASDVITLDSSSSDYDLSECEFTEDYEDSLASNSNSPIFVNEKRKTTIDDDAEEAGDSDEIVLDENSSNAIVVGDDEDDDDDDEIVCSGETNEDDKNGDSSIVICDGDNSVVENSMVESSPPCCNPEPSAAPPPPADGMKSPVVEESNPRRSSLELAEPSVAQPHDMTSSDCSNSVVGMVAAEPGDINSMVGTDSLSVVAAEPGDISANTPDTSKVLNGSADVKGAGPVVQTDRPGGSGCQSGSDADVVNGGCSLAEADS